MPEDSISFDRAADFYDATRGYPPEVSAQLAEGFQRVGPLPAGSAALELGIGTGRIALPLVAAGVDVAGVDISPRMLERLHTRYSTARAADPHHPWGTLRTQVASITELPFADVSFQAVLAVHVLHLVAGWRRVLDEVLRVLRPDGAFLLGQDAFAPDAFHVRLNERWARLVEERGFPLPVQGARYGTVLDELRARGLHVTEHVLVHWEVQRSPAEAVTRLASRLLSSTWSVPDAIFDDAMRQVEAETRAEYGAAYETPLATPFTFTLARATR